MSLKDTEIDENGFAIIEPLIQMDVDTKKDEKKYSKIYHREYYGAFWVWKSSVSSAVVALSRRKWKSMTRATSATGWGKLMILKVYRRKSQLYQVNDFIIINCLKMWL